MGESFSKLGLAVLAYFSPVREIFILMMVFVAVDLITGIIASRNRQVPRSSRRLRKSVVKLMCYIAAVILAFWAEKVLGIEWFSSHLFVASFICGIEFISILENFAVFTEHPVFLSLIKAIRGRSTGNNITQEIINEKNDFFNTDHFGNVGPADKLQNAKNDNGREPIGYIRYRDPDRDTSGHSSQD